MAAASSASSERITVSGPTPGRSPTEGVALAFLGFAFYAWSDAAVKLLHGALPPFEVVCIGALLGLPAVPFVCGPGDRLRDAFRASSLGVWALRGALAVAGSLGSVVAFTHLSMPEAFSLIFLLPAFVTILSVVVLGERVGWRRWSAVVLGFVGVLVVLRPGFRALGIGHLAAACSALAGAGTVVMLRALGGREKPVSLYGAGLMGPIVVSGLLAAPGFVLPTAREWLLLAGYGLLAAVAGVLVQIASRLAPATLVAPTQYSQMLWAIAFGAFVFGDPPDAPTYAGAAIIVGSGLFTLLRERARRVPAAEAAPPMHLP